MKIALVIAPGIQFAFEGHWGKKYASIDVLQSYLRQKGIESQKFHLANELRETLSKPERVQKTINIAKKEINIIEQKEELKTEELEIYLRLKSIIKVLRINPENKKAIVEINTLIYSNLFIDNKANKHTIAVLNELVEKNKLQEFDLVGFSIPFSTVTDQTFKLAEIIKSKNKESNIIIGGKFLQELEQDVIEEIKKNNITTYCIGDGEKVLLDTINKIRNGEIPKGKQVGKEISISEHITIPDKGETFSFIYLSKGCYWNRCTFCSRHKLTPKFKIKDINTILNEIKELIHSGVEMIDLISDALPKNYARKISQFLIDNDYKIKWHTDYFRVAPVYEAELLKLMKKSGFDFDGVFIGVDGFTDKVLEMEDKGYTVKEIKEFFQNLQEAKVTLRAMNNIYNFPGATLSESLKGLELMEEYPDVCEYFGLIKLQYIPYNQIAENPSKFGIELVKTKEKNPYGFAIDIKQPNGLSKEEEEEIYTKGMNIISKQRAMHKYKLDKEIAKVRMYSSKKHELNVKLETKKITIESSFDTKGKKTKQIKVSRMGERPINVAIMKHQEIINKLKEGQTYSFDEVKELIKDKNENNIINIQKTFQMIIFLANHNLFESMNFKVKTSS